MFRFTAALAALFSSVLVLPAARAGAPAGESAPAPTMEARSKVWMISDPSAVVGFEENPAITRRMVDRIVLAVTQRSDVKGAWKSLVNSKDVVGIKIAAAGGKYFSTHRGVVEAIAAGLEQAGVPRGHIIVFDRDTANLRAAGFGPRSSYPVRGIDPPRGLDPASKFFAPVFGKLIWGDLGFQGRKVALKPSAAEEDQLSPESHLPFLLTRELTKIVNVATFSDEAGCGVAGVLYNATVPMVDNNRRFTQMNGASAICDLWIDDHIGPRVVFNMIDGLVAQYAGGPQFSPNYAHAHQTLYASKDPVALDAIVLEKLEEWRKLANLPAIGKRGAWLAAGEELGLGHCVRGDIDLQTAPSN